MKRGFMRSLLLVVAAFVFLFSSVMVFRYRLELRTGAQFAENIAQMVVASSADYAAEETMYDSVGVAAQPLLENESPASGEAPAVTEEEIFNDAPETVGGEAVLESEARVVRVAPIQVDFDALLAENPDVVAWLYCPDTPINYPVVQAEDNDYYMHRLLDGSKSYPGTLFMDYRNTEDFSDWNSVIYGHNMRNDSMFGTLPDYKEKEYFETHPEIYLLTPQRDYVIDVLAGFVTPNNSELYNSLRPEDAEKESLLKDWLGVAGFAADEYPAMEDRMITLSTCSYEYKNARYVLIGSLEELGI